MRVLVITNFFPPHYAGGAEVSAYNTCLGMRGRGVDVSVLVVNARTPQRATSEYVIPYSGDARAPVSGPLGHHADDPDGCSPYVAVKKVTWRTRNLGRSIAQSLDPRVYRAVLGELRRLRPDLVHVHNVSGASLAPFVACRRARVPVVLTLHDHWLLCANNMLYRGDGVLCDPADRVSGCGACFRRYDFWADIPWRRQVFAWLVQNVALFVSPSQRLVDLHVAAGYDRTRFRVVPNGIYSGLSRAPSDPLAREYVRSRGRYQTLLFAGAVVESKGLQTLIDALPLLARYVERFRLLVAGWGDERYLGQLRRADPLVVKLLGRLPFEEMRALYAAADLTVVPSIWYDNSPMVIYESLLAGTPVLGSDIGGIPELILPGQTGYVFSPGDLLALTEKVIQHFGRSALERRRMRHCCLEYARTRLTMEHHLDRLQQVYGEALGH